MVGSSVVGVVVRARSGIVVDGEGSRLPSVDGSAGIVEAVVTGVVLVPAHAASTSNREGKKTRRMAEAYLPVGTVGEGS